MENEEKQHCGDCKNYRYSYYKKGGCGAPCGVYGLGLIGALIYYIQHASGFWPIVLGILKAIVWPAMIVYKLLAFLHM